GQHPDDLVAVDGSERYALVAVRPLDDAAPRRQVRHRCPVVAFHESIPRFVVVVQEDVHRETTGRKGGARAEPTGWAAALRSVQEPPVKSLQSGEHRTAHPGP